MNEFVEKNHYVPESYLKRWGDANAKISVYRILVPNQNMPLWKKASARGLANHRHLYTQIITSEESDEIERWFNTEFESPAAASIEKAVSDNQLSPEDWKNLIRFLAAQDVRTPARMLEILKQGEKIVPEVTDNILKNLEQDLRKLKAEGNLPKPDKHNRSKLLPIKVTTDFLSNQDYVTVKVQTTVGRGYWLYCIKLLLEQTIERLLKHQWTILHSPKEIDWLTSDDPVVKLNYYSPREYDFGGGWAVLVRKFSCLCHQSICCIHALVVNDCSAALCFNKNKHLCSSA